MRSIFINVVVVVSFIITYDVFHHLYYKNLLAIDAFIFLITMCLLSVGWFFAHKNATIDSSNFEAKMSIDSIAKLTPREIQILEFITSGKSNKEIAAIVNISPLTIKTHVRNLFKKLGVHKRVEIMKYQRFFRK